MLPEVVAYLVVADAVAAHERQHGKDPFSAERPTVLVGDAHTQSRQRLELAQLCRDVACVLLQPFGRDRCDLVSFVTDAHIQRAQHALAKAHSKAC